MTISVSVWNSQAALEKVLHGNVYKLKDTCMFIWRREFIAMIASAFK